MDPQRLTLGIYSRKYEFKRPNQWFPSSKGGTYVCIYTLTVFTAPLLHFKKIFQVRRLSSESLLPWQLTLSSSSLSLTVNPSFPHLQLNKLRAGINLYGSLNADHESELIFVRWCCCSVHAVMWRRAQMDRNNFPGNIHYVRVWRSCEVTLKLNDSHVHFCPSKAESTSYINFSSLSSRCHRNKRNSARLLWATSDTGLRGFVTLKSTLTGKTVRAAHETNAGVSVDALRHPGHGRVSPLISSSGFSVSPLVTSQSACVRVKVSRVEHHVNRGGSQTPPWRHHAGTALRDRDKHVAFSPSCYYKVTGLRKS